MDANEYAALHRKNEMAREAIHDCVHDVACACRHVNDRLHQRIEAQLCEVSWEVTKAAQQHHQDHPSPS